MAGYRIVTSVPPNPSNSVRATPLPVRNAGGWTEPVSTRSPAFSILPCLLSVLASQASEIIALPITAVPGPLASSLPSSSERPLRFEVELLPVLDLGAGDQRRLQHVVGDARGTAHLGD